MLPSSGLSASESTSVTKKSLNSLHTHSGYSADKKKIITLNERALVGARTRNVSIGVPRFEAAGGVGERAIVGREPVGGRRHAGAEILARLELGEAGVGLVG